jgi:hypothetical protein
VSGLHRPPPWAAVPALRATRRRLVLAAGWLLLCSPARAHDFHASLCDIQFNPRSGNTEIVQSYPMHDIEAAFWLMNGRHLDAGKPADEAVLRAYFDKTFVIEKADRSIQPIRWVGMAVDADTLTVYQELIRTRPPVASRLRNTVLQDFFPDYVSNVNLRGDGKVRTLLFNRKNPVQALL